MIKLLDQHKNNYHHSINRKPVNAGYSVLTKKLTPIQKFKVNDRVRNTYYKNSFSKCHTENWSKDIFINNSVLKNNSWIYKVKDLNREKIIESFYVKEFMRSKRINRRKKNTKFLRTIIVAKTW